MKVIIPAAGKGTRVRPFTHTKPKPLLPVAGKAAIDHILDRVLVLNPTEIVFVVGYLKDPFIAYIKHHYSQKVKLTFVEQKVPRGSAQAYWLARKAFSEDVLVVYSDTIFDADLSIIKKCKDDGIFWAMEVEDPSRFGVMVTDKNGHITKIVEKPAHPVSNLANIGVYYHKNTKILRKGLEQAIKKLRRTKGEVYHVEAFEWMIAHGAKIKVVPAKAWYDTGTISETLETNKRLLLKQPHAPHPKKGVIIKQPVWIHDSAHLERCTIGPNVSIGKNTKVIGSTIQDSIIDEDAVIDNATLRDSIVGQHAQVRNAKGTVYLGDHSRVE